MRDPRGVGGNVFGVVSDGVGENTTEVREELSESTITAPQHPQIHTYIHAYIHTHMHTYIHAYIHTNIEGVNMLISRLAMESMSK